MLSVKSSYLVQRAEAALHDQVDHGDAEAGGGRRGQHLLEAGDEGSHALEGVAEPRVQQQEVGVVGVEGRGLALLYVSAV